MDEHIRILLIEDSIGFGRLIRELLVESAFDSDLQVASSMKEGLEVLVDGNFDIVLLDMSEGLENLISVRKSRPDIAVIVLTGQDNEETGLLATQAGAQDYLVKGRVSSWFLVRSIRYAIERKRFESRLEYLATHDDLTGLANRQLFNYTLSLAIERSRREQYDHSGHGKIAVMLLDLDNFKLINDSYGHIHGDSFLRAVAMRLQNCVRKSDTVARMGGDEFTLVVEDIQSWQDVSPIAEKVLASLNEPFLLEGHRIKTTASIGISLYPEDGLTPETLLQYADIAMYIAKQDHNSYQYYSRPGEGQVLE